MSLIVCKLCNSFSNDHYLCEKQNRKLLDALECLIGLRISGPIGVCEKCAERILNVHTFVTELRKCYNEETEHKSENDYYIKDKDDKTVVSPIKFRMILPKVESQEEQSERTREFVTKRKSTQRMYKCLECSEMFHAHRQLKAHEAVKHKRNGNLNICEYCCCLYGDAEMLAQHKSDKHADSKYVCLSCNKLYGSRGRLQQHLISVHKQNTLLYRCALCETHIIYTQRTHLEQHFQQEHAKTATEGISTEALINDDKDMEMTEEFLDEFLLGNSDENSFQFSEWEALDLHLPDMLHNSMDNSVDCATYTCPKCYEGCSNQRTLLYHLAEKHALKVLNCNKCEANFNDADEYRRHKSTHNNATLRNSKSQQCHQCGVCDKTFCSNAALIYHVKTHSRTVTRPHHCPYCSKSFHTDANLKQHLRIVHSRFKRKVCELCDAQFATLDHLKKHVLSRHHNDRKHICHICNRRFTQLCHLKQHYSIHERKNMSPKTTVTVAVEVAKPPLYLLDI